MSADNLGDRMKGYESVPRTRLMPKMPVMLRLDGRAFHTLTSGLEKPVDKSFQNAMWFAARKLCQEISGCQVAYVQSDEITLLLVDYQTFDTQSWFNYEIQKMCSVAAGIASAAFTVEFGRTGVFDCRAWNLPQNEVANCFVWRQQDATRNSLSSLAHTHYPPEELHSKSSVEMKLMLSLQKGVHWNDCPVPQKHGVCVVRESYEVEVEIGPDGKAGKANPSAFVTRQRWIVDENIPIFTQDRSYIEKLVYPPIDIETGTGR